jgi:hypothetical protein
MKPVLEQKLRDLISEAENEAAPAMAAVLELLLGAYLNGKQNDFARHCCIFSPIRIISQTVYQTEESVWPDNNPEIYIN